MWTVNGGAEAGNAPRTEPDWVWRAVCTRRQDGRVEGILPIPVPAPSPPSTFGQFLNGRCCSGKVGVVPVSSP